MNNFLNPIVVLDTTDSTNSSSGSFIISGGVGVSKNVSIGTNLSVGSAVTGATLSVLGTADATSSQNGSTVLAGGLTVAKNTYTATATVAATTESTSATTGSLIVGGGLGLAKNAFIAGTATIANTTESESISTGSLVVSGGIGIAKAATIGGIVKLTDTTESTSTSTGALIVAGGLAVAKNLAVAGNLAVTGTFTFEVATPTGDTDAANKLYVDSLSYLTAGTGLTLSSGTLSVNAAQTQITSVGTLTSVTSTGVVNVTNTTISSSSTTGALKVAGGVGIAGSLFVGTNVSITGTSTFTGTVTVPTPSSSTDAATKLYVDDISYITAGTGLSKSGSTLSVTAAQTSVTSLGTLTGLDVSGIVTITNATESTNVATGALIVSGGLAVVKNATFGATVTVGTPSGGTDATNKSYVDAISYITAGTGLTKSSSTLSVNASQTQITAVGTLTSLTSSGVVTVTNVTDANSATTGATTIAGGLGVAKSLYVGTNIVGLGTTNVGSTNPSAGGGGSINATGDLVMGTSNSRLVFPTTTYGPPTVTTRSVGTRLLLHPAISSTLVDYAIGIESLAMWYSVDGATAFHKFYCGTSLVTRIGATATTVHVTTEATSATSGALIVSGGMGVAKAVFLGTTLAVAGTATFSGTCTVGTPSNGTDATNKTYVDSISYITAGTGLTKSSSTLSVNASQTQITAVGTLTSLTSSGAVTITDATASSSPTTGSLIVSGGIGVAKRIFATGGQVLSVSPVSNGAEASIGFWENTGSTGFNWAIGHNVSSIGSGNFGIYASGGIGSVFDITAAGVTTVRVTTDAGSVSTGALVVKGGLGLAKNLYVGGALNVTTGVATFSNVTDSTSSGSGSVILAGGLGVAKNVWAAGYISSPYLNASRSGLVAYENQAGTTINTGTLSGSATYSQNNHIELTPATNAQVGSVYWYLNPGPSVTVSFDLLYNGSADGINLGLYQSAASPTDANLGGYMVSFNRWHNYVVISPPSITTVFPLAGAGTGPNAGTASVGSYSTLVANNTWAHIVVVFRQGIVLVYINNTLVVSYTSTNVNAIATTQGTYLSLTGFTGGSNAVHRVRNIQIRSNCIPFESDLTTPSNIQYNVGNVSLGGILNVTNATDASSTTTGSLIVSGGAGIAKALYVGTTARVLSTTDSNSSSTGSLAVSGGVGIAKQIYMGGNLNFTGNTPSIAASGATGPLSIDPNFTGSDSYVRIYDRLNVSGTLDVTYTTESTSTTTGAITSAGGLGVANAAFIGGALNVTVTTESTSITSGALIVAGGLGVAKTAYFGSAMSIAGTNSLVFNTNSAIRSTGASSASTLVMSSFGGTGITIAASTGNVAVASTTESTSSTSGAMTVAGGLGVAKALSVGTLLNVGGTGSAASLSSWPLYVNAFYNGAPNQTYAYYAKGASSPNTGYVASGGGSGFSIYCSHGVLAIEFNAYSDERIKTNIQDINTSSALEVINQLRPRKYEHVDPMSKSGTAYGFVGQELRAVIPEATDLVKDIIPNVFDIGSVASDGTITVPKPHEFSVGDTIQIVLQRQGQEGEQTVEYKKKVHVTVVINATSFKIDELLDTTQVFVYGKQIDDFHTINKETVYTIGIAAIQELYKLVKDQQEQIELLKAARYP